ncbi:MAG: hypothetical protein M2R45_03585 [Verrucomicrobia subdivision 3 bacterium]|nr:hypothetical protein [Limisphaerales bacterium]MCS1414782.1 hypothetical protein [Limisphaerales bacterium]
MTKLKSSIVAAATGALLTTPAVVYFHGKAVNYERALAAQLERENASAEVHQVESVEPPRLPNDQYLELMRLRGEVGPLRAQVRKLKQAMQEREESLKAYREGEEEKRRGLTARREEIRQITIQRMGSAKELALGMLVYANQNKGKFSGRIEDVLTVLAEEETEARAQLNLLESDAYERFDFVYSGRFPMDQDPAKTIVLREREPWLNADNRWARIYAFADGHVKVHTSDDPDFSEWEAERMPMPAAASEDTF